MQLIWSYEQQVNSWNDEDVDIGSRYVPQHPHVFIEVGKIMFLSQTSAQPAWEVCRYPATINSSQYLITSQLMFDLKPTTT